MGLEAALRAWMDELDCLRIDIEILGTGLAMQFDPQVSFGDGRRRVIPPREISFMVSALRDEQALPGWGAWTWARLWMTADEGVLHGEYDWMREPIFDDPTGDGRPLSGDCARELKNYPRDPENIPEWMAAGVAAFEKREAKNARRRERYRERKEQKAREIEAQNDHADTAGSSVEE